MNIYELPVHIGDTITLWSGRSEVGRQWEQKSIHRSGLAAGNILRGVHWRNKWGHLAWKPD